MVVQDSWFWFPTSTMKCYHVSWFDIMFHSPDEMIKHDLCSSTFACNKWWFKWCLRPRNCSSDWNPWLFPMFFTFSLSPEIGKKTFYHLYRSLRADKTLTRHWHDFCTVCTSFFIGTTVANLLMSILSWTTLFLSCSLWLFRHKVFHIHHVYATVLLLRFLERLVSAKTRFNIVIEFSYDVFSGQSLGHIL